MILCKDGVHFKRMLPALYWLFPVIEKVWNQFAEGIDVVITSANDSTHMKGSKHYSDEAIDLRTHTLTEDQKRLIVEQLKLQIDKDYDIVFEGKGTPREHLHLEYQPK